jgi:mannose-6-phosphate isomerase-like protein (cupin superfamily)
MGDTERRIQVLHRTTAGDWQELEGTGLWLGGAAEESADDQISAGFVHAAAGAGDVLPSPYEEVWIVTRGAMTLRDGTNRSVARAGSVVHLLEATPGRFEVIEDVDMIALASPPGSRFPAEAWGEAQKRSSGRPSARVYTSHDPPSWQRIRDQDVRLGAVVEEKSALLRLGFGAAEAVGTMELYGPFDRVVAVTRGSCTVFVEERREELRAGDFIFVPGEHCALVEVVGECEMVWVHNRDEDSPL